MKKLKLKPCKIFSDNFQIDLITKPNKWLRSKMVNYCPLRIFHYVSHKPNIGKYFTSLSPQVWFWFFESIFFWIISLNCIRSFRIFIRLNRATTSNTLPIHNTTIHSLSHSLLKSTYIFTKTNFHSFKKTSNPDQPPELHSYIL